MKHDEAEVTGLNIQACSNSSVQICLSKLVEFVQTLVTWPSSVWQTASWDHRLFISKRLEVVVIQWPRVFLYALSLELGQGTIVAEDGRSCDEMFSILALQSRGPHCISVEKLSVVVNHRLSRHFCKTLSSHSSKTLDLMLL